jgi:hypothetical protein
MDIVADEKQSFLIVLFNTLYTGYLRLHHPDITEQTENEIKKIIYPLGISIQREDSYYPNSWSWDIAHDDPQLNYKNGELSYLINTFSDHARKHGKPYTFSYTTELSEHDIRRDFGRPGIEIAYREGDITITPTETVESVKKQIKILEEQIKKKHETEPLAGLKRKRAELEKELQS